ncbi:UDP-N-acetylmuramate dehydrogenase [Larsenimonas suaedae]|uniref:UDP-N-acetylenolpyruvoylglucosamine reductase n=1 Tax=Larsenimonas suaedae TaxID=1851019 RepID=A0ABU1GUV6_9GAMM|nr:UDP-N-acetylmuramate dehydrogenase [Larsenimonas suaedae]MCM2971111.1 UDP-N-acetylmuramate dehydrogenase [Larsenimonas suaedae]MDR5895820.1 UDP-N-acetylmuramate dehydrogenase [Larsenimonas suaedae]
MVQLTHRADLGGANTFHLPCTARFSAEVGSVEGLRAVLAFSSAEGVPLKVLGGGSNVILPNMLSSLVLRYIGNRAWWGEWVSDTERLHHVEAGADWHGLVMALASSGWWGVENLALIPGTVGAAPIQNIGAYGVELADVVEEVHVVERASGQYRRLAQSECMFGYRDSIFKQALSEQVVIVRVVLRLSSRPTPKLAYQGLDALAGLEVLTPLMVAERVCALRRAKLPDPAEIGNAGSYFKNPVVPLALAEHLRASHQTLPTYPVAEPGFIKLAAGWLIDQCGFKGARDPSGVGVHEHQALVVVNEGHGRAEDILALETRIREAVQTRFGVTLEREPGFWGE